MCALPIYGLTLSTLSTFQEPLNHAPSSDSNLRFGPAFVATLSGEHLCGGIVSGFH